MSFAPTNLCPDLGHSIGRTRGSFLAPGRDRPNNETNVQSKLLAIALLSGCAAAVHPSRSPVPDRGTCDVVVIGDGKDRGPICEADVPADLTIVDLRDAWTPRLFAPEPGGSAPAFRATYLAIAAERGPDGRQLPPSSALAELYGIVPSFAIVRERVAQRARYACHAQIDSAPIAKLARPYGEEHAGLVRYTIQQRKQLGEILERVRVQRNLADFASLASDRELGDIYERWHGADELYAGIVAAQRHLVCEGYLASKDADGTFSWAMGIGLELFQRRNFLIPNGRLDPETRAALATDPRELDFRMALRVLRERVVDATGLIEDGSAGTGPRPIVGRILDPEAMRKPRGHDRALPNAAPDLIGAATEAAVVDLGWTTAPQVAVFLARHPGGMRVAIALPPVPAYHSSHMALSAEIDRGDVWYDEVFTPRVAWRRPALTLFVQDGAVKRPLIRWSTTIGGWSDVNVGGEIVKRWKESDVGPRVWRDLYAAPTWLPPDTTPDEQLVTWLGPRHYELKRSVIGPGPMSAFGMMLLPHLRVVTSGGRTQYVDNGIGTHGSAVVTSILNGTSHCCHRLYNQLAVRLGSFLLRSRNHVVKGQAPEHFRRTIHAGGTFTAKIETRGFLYELVPPVPIEVLPGTIRSERKVPPTESVAAGAE